MKHKILFILPVLSRLNSILYVLTSLLNEYEVIVLTSKKEGLKGKGILPDYENLYGLNIYRIVNKTTDSNEYIKKYKKVKQILYSFDPEIVVCGTWYLLKIGEKISKELNSKLILLTEFFMNSERFIGRKRYYLKINALIPFVGEFLRQKIYNRCDAIILSNFTEREQIPSKYKSKIHIIPWCNHIPNLAKLNWGIDNRKNQAIFAGELSEITINEYFIDSVKTLLNNNIVERIIIIGYGPKENLIMDLKQKYGEKISILGPKSRDFVLKEISLSRFAILTTKNGGWGFIGECFALGTPILYTFNHYNFNNWIDSINFNPTQKKRIDKIKNLLMDKHKYIYLQKNMHRRYIKYHSAEAVAKELSSLFIEILY